MDSILEKHLKKIFIQPITVNKSNSNNQVNVRTNIKKNVSKPDPILEKHLKNIFVDNEEIQNELKKAAEIKRKNEEILNIFNNIIETKIAEPVQEAIKEEPVVEVPEKEEVLEQIDEILDKNLDIKVPEDEKIAKPSVIDAYKSAIQPLPKTLEDDPVEVQVVPEPEVEEPENVYVKSIKDTDVEPRVSVIQSSDEEFFNFLERNRDNPRIKNFFNTHSEAMKKEILKLTENFTREKMLIAAESGGGSGNVNITQGWKKHVEVIGDGINTEYTVAHNFETKDFVVSVFDNITEELVICSAVNLNENEIKFGFSEPIAIGSIRVVIIT